jgi:pimeloyl-ACP methyl ester carboxylesterase
MRRIRDVAALIHDGVDLTTDLVRDGMESTARAVRRVTDQIEPLATPARVIDDVRHVATAGVLGTVQVVNRAVQTLCNAGLDLAEGLVAPPIARDPELDRATPPAVTMRSDVVGSAVWSGDAALGLLNAAVGDYLQRQGNGLDLGMRFRIGDRYVPLERAALAAALSADPPQPRAKVALFVHGLATTEWSWCLGAQAQHGEANVNFGTLLQRDCGYTPIWLRYNSGRHVSENGRQLAAELERLVAAYPIPIESLVLIGHSMGGLLLRSASHYGQQQALRWPSLVRHVICLGTPHRGAPLEKLGHVLTRVLGAIDLPGTRIPARILSGRSAGIRDLRHGSLLDEEWPERDPAGDSTASWLPHAHYLFVSATVTDEPAHPVGQLMGDLLVRTASSSGPSAAADRPTIETHHVGGVLHHQLQTHPAVYALIRKACS